MQLMKNYTVARVSNNEELASGVAKVGLGAAFGKEMSNRHMRVLKSNVNMDFTKRINSNEITNALFTHLGVSFGRQSFANITADANTSEDDTLFTKRIRPQIRSVHMLRDNISTQYSNKDMTIDNHLVARYLASDEARGNLLTQLGEERFITKALTFIMGATGRAKKGTKRYTFQRLVNWMRSNLETNIVQGVEAAVVGAIIYRTILDQFDWEFSSIEVTHVNQCVNRMLTIDDMIDIYKEGWLQQNLPQTNAWVVKYAGADEVIVAAAFDVIASSIAALRRQLISVRLLRNRAHDVVNAAILASALNLGIVETVGSETLLEFVESSPAIQELSQWYNINSRVFKGGYSTNGHAGRVALQTKVGDVSLLMKFADEFLSAVKSHPLVTTIDAGDFVRHITIEHASLPEGGRFHTKVRGNPCASTAPRQFLEAALSSNLYAINVIKDNDKANTQLAQALSRIYTEASSYICEQDQLNTFGELSRLLDPKVIWNKGKHTVTVTDVTSVEIDLLAALQSDLLVRYARRGSNGDTYLELLDTYYIVNNASQTVATPYAISGDIAYTADPLVALALGNEKAGAGNAAYTGWVADVANLDFTYQALSQSDSIGKVSKVARVVASSLAIGDETGTVQTVNYHLDGDAYLVMGDMSTNTYNISPYEFEVITATILYALQQASAALKFQRDQILEYDRERLNATLLNTTMDELSKVTTHDVVAKDVRYNAAVQLSGVVGSWTAAYHNIAIRVSSLLAASSFLFDVLDIAAGNGIRGYLQDGYANNRIFRERVIDIAAQEARYGNKY